MGADIEGPGKGGGDLRVSWTLFKAVVQAVLLFGSNTWVMTPHMGQNLGGVYHRVSHRLMEKKLWHIPDDIWQYPPFGKAT